MRDDRRAVRRRARGRSTGPVVVVLAATALTAGCTGSAEKVEESPSPTVTPLADIDLTGVVATRAAFCDALDPEAVAGVLGGEPERANAYVSGQRVELAPGLRDVANEYSCRFERGSRTARAWLFAQPVTSAQATAWVKERSRADGCESTGELSYGDPGVVQSCAEGERRRVTAAGLFGDGWLTCQTTAPRTADEAELLERTQRWCAEVARATA